MTKNPFLIGLILILTLVTGILIRLTLHQRNKMLGYTDENDSPNEAQSWSNLVHPDGVPEMQAGINRYFDLPPQTDDSICVSIDMTESRHLLGIIDDILDFSKIEAGKLEIEDVDFTLDTVIKNLTNLVASRIESKGLHLIYDFATDVPNSLRGDPLRLGQILINFTNNAIKFSNQGDIIVRAFVGAHRFAGLCEVLESLQKDEDLHKAKDISRQLWQLFEKIRVISENS